MPRIVLSDLQPELLRISELNDNTELSSRASFLLTRMCGVSPPKDLIGQILNVLFEAIQQSPVSFLYYITIWTHTKNSVLENPAEGIAPTSSFLFQTNALDQ
jgi:hypothetical protein